MLMPSIFGENLFDDFFNDFPFYDYDKEMKNTEKVTYWPQNFNKYMQAPSYTLPAKLRQRRR